MQKLYGKCHVLINIYILFYTKSIFALNFGVKCVLVHFQLQQINTIVYHYPFTNIIKLKGCKVIRTKFTIIFNVSNIHLR